MKKAASPPAPFPSQAACLEGWFDHLGPMNGSSGKEYRSGIFPIEGRLEETGRLLARNVATRASGVKLPFFDALESFGPDGTSSLDLLDRLLLLALLRDSFDARSSGGLVMMQLCDAAGAATHVQQEMVRKRLEDNGRLRAHLLVQSDADPDFQKRYYRVPAAAREALLRGETAFEPAEPRIP